MSQVSVQKFTSRATLYAILSLIGYFITAFTIPAWLVYSFVLTPFYAVCLLYLLKLRLKHDQGIVRAGRSPLYLSLFFQVLMVLTSPASCVGWKQGEACYSLLQAHATGFQANDPHWAAAELMFPIAILLHIVFVISFLNSIRLESK